VDEATRTAEARVIIPNPDGEWRPGMFLTAKIYTGTINADISIPTSALQLMDGQPAIFVETDHGFEPRPITVGIENDSTVQVLSGLIRGQRFIAKGAFTLKSELQKESFGGHSH
jgi:cobalt-zinc-cadmium efflux system membrane fusion protein